MGEIDLPVFVEKIILTRFLFTSVVIFTLPVLVG